MAEELNISTIGSRTGDALLPLWRGQRLSLCVCVMKEVGNTEGQQRQWALAPGSPDLTGPNRHDRGNVAQSAGQNGGFCINPRKGALGSVDTYVK